MCGFVGQIGGPPAADRARLYRMANTLSHRGPDESGIIIGRDKSWGVAHRRLCVVDLDGGKQPMVYPDLGLTLVYNGEIYDHDRIRRDLDGKGWCFRTKSDTEVLLALYAVYGLDFFPHLRGEFAFALIDERKGEAILVRDRLGLKPLFYTRTPNSLLFASEIKALFRAPEVRRALSPAGVAAAVSVADTPGDTVFEDVRQVRHAHYLRVRLDSLATSEHRYWDAWTHRSTHVPTDPREVLEGTRERIDEAIRLRLRADAPVGAYLSGGLDSSIVTTVMAKNVDRLDAFGLAFEDSPRHNEFHYAEAVAARLPNVRLHRIPVTFDSMVRKLPETVWHLERPFGNLHSVAKLLAAQYARDYVVCVLTGDGGDECFCGYSTHWLQNALQKAHYSLPAIQRQLSKMQAEAAGIGGNRYYLAGGLAKRIGKETQFLSDKLGFRPADLATAVDAAANLNRLFHPDFARRIAQPPVERLVDQLATSMPVPNGHAHASLLQYIQLNTSVPEYIAAIADRMEWAGSVESRPPLFDHKVVEWALAMPLEWKLRGDREKFVLREAYADVLPTEVLNRRKQAFLAPPAPFASAAGAALLERYLNPAAVREAGVWNPRVIRTLLFARRFAPRNRMINLALTITLTAQILHDQFVTLRHDWT
jgi:asparagine synthase (glutamine-hydrolysing)